MAIQANDILLSVFARTDVGRQRAGNEDAFLIADLTQGNVGLGPEMITHPVGECGSLLIVSDGMGGAAAGEIASEVAVNAIRESLFEIPTDLGTADRLRIATELANERIWNQARSNPKLQGMGATVTAVLVHGSIAFAAQVGDSRAYVIRNHRIKQITKDQSYAQALRDSGIFSPEQIANVPQNVILQALGTQPTVQVGLTAVELHRNDYLILCSDGLSGKIEPEEIRDFVCRSPDLTHACRHLVDTANERGGEDNITVIVASFDGVGLDAADESTSITGSFRSLSEDFRPQEANDTQPLGSAPPADTNATTVMMPSIASVKKASPEINASTIAGGLSSSDSTESNSVSAASGKKYVTAVVKKKQLKKSRIRTRLLVISLLFLLILFEIGYLLYKLALQR
jgi:serine/threonine protein phosphatase PrpC